MKTQNQRTSEIESSLEQIRYDAENAQFNMEQFGLDSYNPKQLHKWKEDFESGLDEIRSYSEKYRQTAHDNSIAGINARKSTLSCIDYLTQEIVSRIKLRGERK